MKPFEDLEFNEMVDVLAGDALLRLVKGDNWRTIIWFVCQQAVQWRALHKDKK